MEIDVSTFHNNNVPPLPSPMAAAARVSPSPFLNATVTNLTNIWLAQQPIIPLAIATKSTTTTLPLRTPINLTRIAVEVSNYTLQVLDVGVGRGNSSNAIPQLVIPAFANYTNNSAHSDTTASIYSPAEPSIEDDDIRLEHAPQLSKSAMVKVYVLSVMALLSLLGNILTMWNIYKTRISRRSSRHSWSAIYSLIFHLSIADVLVTGFCIIGEAAWYYTVQWMADELTCKLVKLCQMFSLYLSTYVLVLIGVDRWIAVKYPMKSLNMAKRCYRLLGCTYIFSFILSLPQFFIFHVARGPFIEEFHQCVTHGFYTALWQEQLYATFTLVFTFLLPLCILFGTYLSTFRTISSSEKMFQGFKVAAYNNHQTSAQTTNRQRLIHKAKMKSLRISVVIIFAFLICWAPYYVMMMIFQFSNPDERLGEDLNSAIFFFGMSNSLVNPLIYGAFHLCPMDRKTNKSGSAHNAHSLNRGDSQRTMLTAVTQIDGNGRQLRSFRHQPSYYRSHSHNGGSSSNCREHVGLLQVSNGSNNNTPTPTIIGRKAQNTPLVRSPHPLHSSQVLHLNHMHTHTHLHNNHRPHTLIAHPSLLLGNSNANGIDDDEFNGSGSGSDSMPHSTIVLNYREPKSTSGISTALRANNSGSLNAISILGKKSSSTIGGGGSSGAYGEFFGSTIHNAGAEGRIGGASLHGLLCAADESISSV